MKKFALLVLLSCWMPWVYAQSNQVKVIIADSASYMTDDIKEMIQEFLVPAGVDRAEFLDYNARCEYYIVNIIKQVPNYDVSVTNCNRQQLGKSTIYKEINLASEEQKAKALAFEIVAILKTDSTAAPLLRGDGTKQELINHHDSRHFFAPSAYNLKKGELYYSTYFGLQHEIQYGLTDNFSVGGGTTVGIIPIYVTPKLSFRVAEKVQLAVGDLFVAGTYVPFVVNVAYGALTIGSHNKNVTFSGGMLNTTFTNFEGRQIGPQAVMNISTMQGFSRYVYLISENYFVPRGNSGNANNIFAGFSGLRFVRKKKDVGSWQVGILYFVLDDGFFDPSYLALPNFSYTHKFGKKL
jgi:hypothetical protein